MGGAIVLAMSDLMFESRIADAARRLGLKTGTVASGDSLLQALEGASLVVVDLQAEGFDPLDAVRQAVQSGVPVIAFGQHTQAGVLRRAREAGAKAMARSAFFEELPVLLTSAAQAARSP